MGKKANDAEDADRRARDGGDAAGKDTVALSPAAGRHAGGAQQEDPPAGGGGLSRRDFLRGSAAAGALGGALLAGGEGAGAAVAAPRSLAGVELAGPGAVPMTFQINGKRRRAALEPRVTLLDALRDHFDLTAAKKVCDRGTCGACTVLLAGRAVYSCSVLAIEAQGKAIETVEGLGAPDKLHPLQAAFVDNDAQQCGFCTPGFVMAAKALLDHNPHPALADVHRALSGNFCRCGTYAGLRQAVLGLAPARGGSGQGAPAPGTPGGGHG